MNKLRQLSLDWARDKNDFKKQKAIDEWLEILGQKYNFNPQTDGISMVDGLIFKVPPAVRDMKGEIDK